MIDDPFKCPDKRCAGGNGVLEAVCKIRLSLVSKLESLFPRVRHLIHFIIHCTKQLTCTVSDSYRATIFGDVESLICLSISIKEIHPSSGGFYKTAQTLLPWPVGLCSHLWGAAAGV